MKHLKTLENQLDCRAKNVVLKEDMAGSVECEICLEKCQKGELKEHRKICMARLIFRCTICDGDYVSKEGLWNHLDLHEVADENKELNYQEMRVTYKLNQCVMCNDQRGYQDSLYWKHVYKEHDGFFLRCSECGESFRSQKLKTNHDLTHSQTEEETVDMNKNAAVQFETSQGEFNNVPEKDRKCSEINEVDQQGTLMTEKIKREHIDSRFSEFSPGNSNVADDKDNTMTKKISKVLPFANSKSKSNVEADEEKISQLLADNPSSGSSDTNKSVSCEFCGLMFKNLSSVNVHISGVHHIEGDLKNTQVDVMSCKNQQEQNQAEQITLKMEITVEETTLQHDNFGISTSKVEKSVLSLVDFCRQKSDLSQKRKPDMPEELACPILKQDVVYSRLNEHSSANLNSAAYDMVYNMTEKEPKVLTEEKNLQKLVENPLNSTSEIKCFDCDKEFTRVSYLARHIKLNHQPYPCPICGITLPNSRQAQYHKMTAHTEAKHKCPHCPRTFYQKISYQEHLSVCVTMKIPCDVCGLKFISLRSVNVHKERTHYVEQSLSKAQIDQKGCSQKQATVNSEQSIIDCSHRGEDTLPVVENISSASSDIKCSHCGKQFVSVKSLSGHIASCGKLFPGKNSALVHKKTKHTDLIQHTEIQEVVDPESSILNYNGRNSALTQETTKVSSETKAGKTLQPLVDQKGCSQEQVSIHTEQSFVGCGRRGKDIQPLAENVSNASFDIKCSHCRKQFVNVKALSSHINNCHKPTTCNICREVFPGRTSAWFHKKTQHVDLSQHAEQQKIVNPEPKAVNSSGQNSVLAQVSSDTHKEIDPMKGSSENNTGKTLQPLGDTKCAHCGKEYASAFALTRHIELVHVPRSCNVCGITFPSCTKARYHKIMKHTEAKHQCPQCTQKFHFIKSYQAHLPHCKVRKFSCLLCDQKFRATKYVGDHMREVHKIKGALKKILIDRIRCNEKHEENQSGNIGRKQDLSEEETTLNPFVITDCPICGKNFGDQNQVSHHVEAVHQMTICISCGMTFTSAEQLNNHKLTCPQRKDHIGRMKSLMDYQTDRTDCNEQEQEPQPFEDLNLLQGENMELKMEIKVEETTLQEQEYQAADEDHEQSPTFTIMSASQLKAQKLTYHTERKFKCPNCPRSFIFKKIALVHMRTHKSNKNEHLKLLQTSKLHRYGNISKVIDHENGTNIKEARLGDETSVIPQISTESSQCIDVFGNRNVSDETNDQMKACSICGVTFENRRKMQYHKWVFHTERKYKCSMCPLTYHFGYMLRRHEKKHIKINNLLCNRCNLKFSSHHKLNYHMKRFHTEPGLKCPECGKLYNVQHALRRHIAIHLKTKHKKMKENTKILEQKIDDKLEQNQGSSERFDHEHEIGIKKNQSKTCSICELIIPGNMDHHRRTVHREPKHKCSHCPKKFYYSSKLNHHERTHSNILERNVVCKLCPKTFRDEYSLQRHVNITHRLTEIPCDMCDLKFTSRPKLYYHVKRIHTEPAFKCPDCGKLFNLQNALRRHMTIHLKAKKQKK